MAPFTYPLPTCGYRKGVFIMSKRTVIAAVNQKCDISKTTTTENVAIGLARNGNRVLILHFNYQLTQVLDQVAKNDDKQETSF